MQAYAYTDALLTAMRAASLFLSLYLLGRGD
jgi:hypothetical protein